VNKIRLVDGAYFDNSGVATAMDLIQSMQEAARRQGFADRIRINLIALTSGGYPQQEFYGLGEAMSPIGALLSTRTARSYITIAAAERELNRAGENGPTASAWPRLRKVVLKDMDYPPPLGWRLSSITMLLIEAQNGIASECEVSGGNPKLKPGRFDSDCLLQSLSVELAH
jgi:hypothetical protein